jgi:hypothetical protein
VSTKGTTFFQYFSHRKQVTFSSPLYLAGHAACMSEMKYRQKILVPNRDEMDFKDLLDGV